MPVQETRTFDLEAYARMGELLAARFEVDQLKKNINKLNKEVGLKFKVRPLMLCIFSSM